MQRVCDVIFGKSTGFERDVVGYLLDEQTILQKPHKKGLRMDAMPMLPLPIQCQIEMFEGKQEQPGIDDVLRSMY